MRVAEVQMVVFSVHHEKGKVELGVPIEKVQEINRLLEITRLPQCPDFVEGIVNLRGQVIPVIDLKKRFKLDGNTPTDQTRIIVFEVLGEHLGIIVDEVSEVLRIQELAPPPPGIGLDASYLDGVAKVGDRLILLINLEEIFTLAEWEQLSSSNLT